MLTFWGDKQEVKAAMCQEVKSQVHSFKKRDLFTLFTTPREHKAGAQQSGIFAPGPGRNFESKAVPRCCKEGLDLQLQPKASFRRGIRQNGENEHWRRLGTCGDLPLGTEGKGNKGCAPRRPQDQGSPWKSGTQSQNWNQDGETVPPLRGERAAGGEWGGLRVRKQGNMPPRRMN